MIYSFPPYFFVLVFGLLFGGGSVAIVLLVFLIKHLTTKREQPYEVETSVRMAAFLIDTYIISLISSFIQVLISAITSVYHYPLPMILSNTMALSYFNTLPLLISPFYILFQFAVQGTYLLTLQNVNVYIGLFLPYIILFLYYFIFETALEGKTIGKLIFRVKTVSRKDRSLKFYEALVNSLGKSFFCVVDLIIGLIVLASVKKPEGVSTKPRQIRLMQRLAGVSVIRTPRPLPY